MARVPWNKGRIKPCPHCGGQKDEDEPGHWVCRPCKNRKRAESRKRREMSPEEIRVVVQLHHQGFGIREIGRRLKYNWAVISEALRGAGIELKRGGRVGAPTKWGDSAAVLPIGKMPKDHPLAALDAMIIAERRWALAQHQARERRLAAAGISPDER